MKRREFLGALGGALAAHPLAARAQQHDKIARIGILGPSHEKNPISRQGYAIFLTELRRLGFAEGQNIQVEFGRTDEDMAGAFAAANEMVAHKADVLVANGPEVTLQAAAAARPQVPIVMLATNFDPFARGYVKNLADPGGNITGIFYRQPELAAKQLELLAEAFPERKRIGTLWDIQSAEQADRAEAAAQSMGLSLHSLKLENPPYNFDAAFQALARGDVQMLEVLSSPLFTEHGPLIAALAIRYRLPSMFVFKYYVEMGGLMSYSVDAGHMWRRAASYVAKILRGARTGDLPIERAENFEFTVNLKTAKAIGVTLPTSILLRADEVIE
jgi:putative tryptophan/tyrosine transport system substrate-binding protein